MSNQHYNLYKELKKPKKKVKDVRRTNPTRKKVGDVSKPRKGKNGKLIYSI